MADIPTTPIADEPTASVPLKPIGKVIAVTSGKGGVGKTFVSANLAAALVLFLRVDMDKSFPEAPILQRSNSHH